MPTKAYDANDLLAGIYVELDNGTRVQLSNAGVYNDLLSAGVSCSDASCSKSDVEAYNDLLSAGGSYAIASCSKSNKDIIADAVYEIWAAKLKEEEKEKEKVEKKLLGTVKIKYNDQVTKNPLSIDHVIFSGPATIVFWADGDKTIVKCKPGDEYSYDVGIAMATLKKIFGDSYSVYKNDVKRKIKTYG